MKQLSQFPFPSRYRAASHVRKLEACTEEAATDSFNLVIERLLISGASNRRELRGWFEFQSRYRAASHFRSRLAGLP